MGMYEVPNPLASARDLNQGDIIAGVIRVSTPGPKNLALLKGPKLEMRLPEGTFARERELPIELRAFCRLDRVRFAVVLSNSCDNAQGGSLEFAPIMPFQFFSGPNGMTDAEKWKQISLAATGTQRPKRFYLPEHKPIGMPRSEAMLAERFSLAFELFERWVREAGTIRIAALTAEARRHLQWAYAAMHSRNPREDEVWPSDDDLKLKLAFLDEVIPRTRRDEREPLEAERARIVGLVGAPPEPAPAPPADATSPQESGPTA